jgi:hypothetical protein
MHGHLVAEVLPHLLDEVHVVGRREQRLQVGDGPVDLQCLQRRVVPREFVERRHGIAALGAVAFVDERAAVFGDEILERFHARARGHGEHDNRLAFAQIGRELLEVLGRAPVDGGDFLLHDRV